MRPIKTKRLDGIYEPPEIFKDDIEGLPFFRERDPYFEITRVYSIWEPTDDERVLIALGSNILISQIGEPIRPMSVQLTDLKEVIEESAEAKGL